MDILDKINQEAEKFEKSGGELTDLLLGVSEMKAIREYKYKPTISIKSDTKKPFRGFQLHELKDLENYFEGFDLNNDENNKSYERFEELVRQK